MSDVHESPRDAAVNPDQLGGFALRPPPQHAQAQARGICMTQARGICEAHLHGVGEAHLHGAGESGAADALCPF